MSYCVVYNHTLARRADAGRQGNAWTEDFAHEHQALVRARELIETGEHHGVALRDQTGTELSGVCLQLKLGGFLGE